MIQSIDETWTAINTAESNGAGGQLNEIRDASKDADLWTVLYCRESLQRRSNENRRNEDKNVCAIISPTCSFGSRGSSTANRGNEKPFGHEGAASRQHQAARRGAV